MADLDRKLIEILDILSKSKEPVGAKIIAKELNKRGYKIGERAVRYHLKLLDGMKLTKKVGYAGRVITERGLEELEKANISYRLGSIYSNILEKTISANYRFGYVVINRCQVYADFNDALKIIKSVYESGLAVGDRVGVMDKEKFVEINTLCSINFDNILLQNGIFPLHICAGIVKYEDGKPVEFKEIIKYKSTSIDPLRAFIEKKETDVMGIIENGEGYLPANFRCFGVEFLERFKSILEKDELKCIISYGTENVLGLDVGDDKVGVALIGGLTPIAPFVENNYCVEISPMSSIVRLESLHKVKKNPRDIITKKANIRIKTALSKMFNAMAKVTYDIDEGDGDVVVNIAYIDKKYLDEALDLLKEAYKKGLGISDRFGIVEENNKIKIQTVCAVTLDGIFLRNSVPTIPRYGGVLEITEDKERFIDIIGYDGSSLDPHEVFFNFVDCEKTFLAGFREVHRVAREKLEEVLKRLNWNGIKTIGEPNNELYGINVNKDMCGVVTIGGINPLVLLKENEIPIELRAMHEIVKFSDLKDYKDF
ncbi:NrpR regulatory domain-containing protein [Methanocaldococcus sp. 10A]